MSLALHRLARFAFRRPGRVLAVWLVLLISVAALLATQPRTIATGFTLQGTPSQQVLDTVTAELPQAGGSQGTLVFTADDGGRVDTPARSTAIAEAARRAVATGRVVDMEGKLADQRAQVRATITTRVEAKVAAQLTPELATLAASLDRAAASTHNTALGELAMRARALTTQAPHAQVSGATKLFADLTALRSVAEGKGLSPAALGLPDGPRTMTSPTAAVSEAVDTAVAPIVADLDRLTAGTAPQGRPLGVGGRTLTTIRVSDDGRMALLPVQFTAQLNGLSPYALSDLLLVTEQAVELREARVEVVEAEGGAQGARAVAGRGGKAVGRVAQHGQPDRARRILAHGGDAVEPDPGAAGGFRRPDGGPRAAGNRGHPRRRRPGDRPRRRPYPHSFASRSGGRERGL